MSNNIITLDETNATVKAVVNQIKSDLRGAGKYSTYVAEFGVTHDTVKGHAAALAALVTPVTAQTKDGKRTRYGNAVQAAGNGLRSALGKADSEDKPTDWIRLVRQAAENANVKGEKSVEEIMSAVADSLGWSIDDNGAITLKSVA